MVKTNLIYYPMQKKKKQTRKENINDKKKSIY